MDRRQIIQPIGKLLMLIVFQIFQCAPNEGVVYGICFGVPFYVAKLKLNSSFWFDPRASARAANTFISGPPTCPRQSCSSFRLAATPGRMTWFTNYRPCCFSVEGCLVRVRNLCGKTVVVLIVGASRNGDDYDVETMVMWEERLLLLLRSLMIQDWKRETFEYYSSLFYF